METGEPSGRGVLLGRGRRADTRDCPDFNWQRVLSESVRSATLVPDGHPAQSVSLLRVHPAALAHDIVLIGGQIVQRFHQAARPANYNFVCLCGLAQAEMQSQVALGNIAVAAANFLFTLVRASLQRNRCSQCGTVRLDADELQADEIADGRGIVVQRGRLVHVVPPPPPRVRY